MHSKKRSERHGLSQVFQSDAEEEMALLHHIQMRSVAGDEPRPESRLLCDCFPPDRTRSPFRIH
jgi:hypothetical protein